MKKKVYLAVITMCMVLTAAACGNNNGEQGNGTNASEEAENTEEQPEQEADEKPSEDDTRLVSVDNVEKYVTIGQYKELTLDNTVEEITDDDVNAQIQQNLADNAQEVKDGTVQMGDKVTINYIGTKDGAAMPGGSAENFDLTVGAGGFAQGFEEGIVGMKKGDTKKMNITLPQDYHEAELAGAEVVYQVTLLSFYRAPELTDAWVAENTDYTTVDEYRAGVRQQMEEYAGAMAQSTLKATAWETVLSNSEVKEYPQEDIDNAIAEFKNQNRIYAQQSGMELEDFVESQGITLEDFEAQCRQYAELKTKQNLIVQGIMDAEGIRLEDAECLAIQDQMIQDYGAADLADLIDKYGQVSVDETIGLLRVENVIIDNAIVQQKVSNGETVGVSGDGGDSLNGADGTGEASDGEEDIGEDGVGVIDEELE